MASPSRKALPTVLAVLLAIGAAAAPTTATATTTTATATATGDHEPADFAIVAALDELTGDHARLFRLYWAAFGREPDPAGAIYWIGEHDGCLGLDGIAELFVQSPEFANRFGQLDDVEFVHRIYRNVLLRQAEDEGLRYWTGLLQRGELTRGGALLNVSLSTEFARQHPYPSDAVPARSCQRLDGASTGRSVHVLADPASTPLAAVAGLTLRAPSTIIERIGFHQSTHPGALAMTAPTEPAVRTTTMASRHRGTVATGAADIAVEPSTAVTAPISGRVARAGSYTLYCRYRDGYVVINPDGRPDLEVKLLHIQGVAVWAGQRVEVGDVVASHATTFPFESQIDELTGEPSWPHVHIEVVDPSIPRKPSSGRSC